MNIKRNYRTTIPVDGCLALSEAENGYIPTPIFAFAVYECENDNGVSLVPLTNNEINQGCFYGYGSVLDENTRCVPKVIRFVDYPLAKECIKGIVGSDEDAISEDEAWKDLFFAIQNSGVRISERVRCEFQKRGFYNN